MREDILLAMKGLSEIYERKITDDLMSIWQSVLKDLSQEELAKGVEAYVLDPSRDFFPKPGQIYALARPQGNKEEEAALITDRIFACLSSHGKDDYGTKRAREKIGELGWMYIEQTGGWSKFGLELDNGDVPTMKSQARKSIMGLIQRKISDMSLPEQKPRSLKSLGIEMKQLE